MNGNEQNKTNRTWAGSKRHLSSLLKKDFFFILLVYASFTSKFKINASFSVAMLEKNQHWNVGAFEACFAITQT